MLASECKGLCPPMASLLGGAEHIPLDSVLPSLVASSQISSVAIEILLALTSSLSLLGPTLHSHFCGQVRNTSRCPGGWRHLWDKLTWLLSLPLALLSPPRPSRSLSFVFYFSRSGTTFKCADEWVNGTCLVCVWNGLWCLIPFQARWPRPLCLKHQSVLWLTATKQRSGRFPNALGRVWQYCSIILAPNWPFVGESSPMVSVTHSVLLCIICMGHRSVQIWLLSCQQFWPCF